MIYVYIYLTLGLHKKKTIKKKQQQHAIELTKTKMVVKFLRDGISNFRVNVKIFSFSFLCNICSMSGRSW